MTELIAQGLTLGDRVIGADFAIAPGELVAIVGPNGSGKSSLLRLLAGHGDADEGTVRVGDAALGALGARERARRLSYLPQRGEVAWPIAVADMVALGRYAYGGAPAKGDDAIVAGALSEVGCGHLARRSTATLSGGELALVALARVFAAETPLLLLDEPTAALDPRRQLDIMARLAARASAGQGVAVVLHDLNLAAQFADRIVWMKGGRAAARTPADGGSMLVQAAAVFGVTLQVETDGKGRVVSLAVRRSADQR